MLYIGGWFMVCIRHSFDQNQMGLDMPFLQQAIPWRKTIHVKSGKVNSLHQTVCGSKNNTRNRPQALKVDLNLDEMPETITLPTHFSRKIYY